jgi:hypothetical protein
VEQVPTLLVKDETIKQTRPIPSINSLQQLLKKLNIQQTDKGDATSILQHSFPGNLPSIKQIPITEAEIKCIIHFLKQKEKNNRLCGIN